MIGKITLGKSFVGCLNYCLNDKLQQAQKPAVMKDRAEVLLYNFCGGNQQELVQQFAEVRQLNTTLQKPVMHVTLSLSPEDQLSRDKLMEICQDCARDLQFEKNQFIAIYHKDTQYQHLHLVVNRIGYDKRTLSDSNNFKKMAAYCRKMELKYELKQVLSPRQFLSEKQRLIPRQNVRNDQLRQAIQQSLEKVSNYQQFEQRMTALGYQVTKGRGIAFTDGKNVKIKGSEVGFSLAKIEKILALKQQLALKETTLAQAEKLQPARKEIYKQYTPIRQAKGPTYSKKAEEPSLQKAITDLIYQVIRPEHPAMQQEPEWLQQKKKKKRLRPHL